MYYIVYNSVTYATGIKNKFRYDRERISVTHTPSKISETGCSYSITVESLAKALEIIRASKEYGVKVRGFYRKTAKDVFEPIKF